MNSLLITDDNCFRLKTAELLKQGHFIRGLYGEELFMSINEDKVIRHIKLKIKVTDLNFWAIAHFP